MTQYYSRFFHGSENLLSKDLVQIKEMFVCVQAFACKENCPEILAMVFSDQILLFCFRFKCWFMQFKMDVILYLLSDLHPNNRCLFKTLLHIKGWKKRENFPFKMMKADAFIFFRFMYIRKL